MDSRKHIVLIRPLSGIFDSLYRVIPLSLLAICRRIDTTKYRITFVDQTLPGWREKLAEACSQEILLVGITSLTGFQLYFGSMLAKYVKRHKPEVPIAWGGVHPTSCPEQMLAEDYADYVVIGEGEDAFPALVDAVAEAREPAGIDGLAYKTPEGVRVNPRQELMDVSELEDLPYHLIDMEEYLKDITDIEFYIEGARGCIYNCTFCYNPTYNQRKWRPRKAERIVDNMVRLHERWGVKNFFICDDSFYISDERVAKFLSLLEGSGIKVKWSCEGNLHILRKLDDATFKRLEESGLNWISIGVESGSDRVRKFYNKPLNESHLIEFNRRMSQFKINIRYNFITGCPIEEKEDLKQTVRLVDQLLEDNPCAMVQSIYITVPFPGTRYLEQCREHGLAVPTSVEEWFDFDPFAVAERLPWMKGRRKRMFVFMMYSSLFVDRKVEYHLSGSLFGRLVTLLGELYRPIARFRFRHLLYYPFPEGALIRWVNRVQMRMAEKKMRI